MSKRLSLTLSEKFKSSGFKKHAISKVFRVWETFPEVRIRKETGIGLCFSHWSISLLDGYNSLRKLPGLLLALPRIHLLFFANMTAVMEEMSMDKEEKSFGPFFLEHFDNSDYGWGVTVRGEGVRHTLTT